MRSGTLLDVQRGDRELRLRLDRGGFACGEEEEPPVVALTLSGCDKLSEAGETLTEAVGKEMYYWCAEEVGETTVVSFGIEYDMDEVEVEVACARVTETRSDYLPEELRCKYRRLCSLYRSTADQAFQMERRHHAFTTGLKAGIDNELDRCRRKGAFFHAVNPERAAAMRAETKVYERVLTLMAFLQRPDQEAAE